jgi:HTH-type transcriptional regulator/antitoxin HigA
MITADYSTCKSPGQLIERLLNERQWSQLVLATIIGIDKTLVNKLVNDKRPVTADLALVLGEVFGIPPEEFIDRQKSLELATARFKATPDHARQNRAHLFGGLPVTEMMGRGWLRADDIRDTARVESELARFFGVKSPGEIEILPHAAKKTQVNTDPTPAQLAWLYRVRQIAQEMLVAKYSPAALSATLPKLHELLIAPEAARKVPRLLAECGVRFVIVETLSSAKIDGACFWLNERSPVVGMTLRYDRIDNFWFVLRHELEHVLRCHGQAVIALDAELEGEAAGTGPTVPEEERVANEAASAFCVPPSKMKMFVSRKSPIFADRDVAAFARMIGVHPGMIVGQIHHLTGRFELLRRHLAKIRSHISPSAIVDGWGDVAQTDF